MKKQYVDNQSSIKRKPRHCKRQPIVSTQTHINTIQPNNTTFVKAVTPRKETSIAQNNYAEEELTLDLLDKYCVPPAESFSPRKKGKVGSCIIINLEDGMPTVEEAIAHMQIELKKATSTQKHFIKFIHGYGSTGVGGKIRICVLKELAALKAKKIIVDYIPGEDLGPFAFVNHPILEQYRWITKDTDFGKWNQGITIVII